jgi:hypothetical protein
LFITGSSTSAASAATTQLYNPNSGASNIGVFSAGPSLPSGCEIAGNKGSVAWRQPTGKYLILSKQDASVEYDPVAGTFGSCNTGVGNGPTVALNDGAHAIMMQNRKLIIIIGAGSNVVNVYDPTTSTFAAHGSTLSASAGPGAHSILKADGTWQIILGGSTTTNKLDTGLVMSGYYVSEDINNTRLNTNSTLSWAIGAERNFQYTSSTTNAAFDGILFSVVSSSTQSGLSSATTTNIQRSGDYILARANDTWVRVTANFYRRLPAYIYDDRRTFTGNGSTIHPFDFFKRLEHI